MMEPQLWSGKGMLKFWKYNGDIATFDSRLHNLREDGRVEWMCHHGVGHTIGHKDKSKAKEDWNYVHGCDGCCSR